MLVQHTQSALEIVEKVASSLAKTLMPDPDASLLVQEIGQYIRWLRLRQGLSAQELACQLDYDPSVVSKVERGQHISPTFIDKLLTSDALSLDDDMRAHLRTYRKALIEAKRFHRQQGLDLIPRPGPEAPDAATPNALPASITAAASEPAPAESPPPLPVATVALLPPALVAITRARWYPAWQTYQPALRSRRVLALVISSGLILLFSVALLRSYNPFGRYMLGTLDFNLACQQQFPGLTDGRSAVLLNPHNPFSWRCPYQFTVGEMTREGDMDTNVACREQYGSLSAWSELRDQQDARSWYCADSLPPKGSVAAQK
ncbi:MAG: helix-turn-helix transcriptional regulator [Anaerolineae bacterium]